MKKSDAIDKIKSSYKRLLLKLDLEDYNFDSLMLSAVSSGSIKVEILCADIETANTVLNSIKKYSKVLYSLGFEIHEIEEDDIRLVGYLMKEY